MNRCDLGGCTAEATVTWTRTDDEDTDGPEVVRTCGAHPLDRYGWTRA